MPLATRAGWFLLFAKASQHEGVGSFSVKAVIKEEDFQPTKSGLCNRDGVCIAVTESHPHIVTPTLDLKYMLHSSDIPSI